MKVQKQCHLLLAVLLFNNTVNAGDWTVRKSCRSGEVFVHFSVLMASGSGLLSDSAGLTNVRMKSQGGQNYEPYAYFTQGSWIGNQPECPGGYNGASVLFQPDQVDFFLSRSKYVFNRVS